MAVALEQRVRMFHGKVAAGEYPNAGWLSKNAGISYRQAQRDIDYMKKVLSAPLCYDYQYKGYYYNVAFVLSDTDANDFQVGETDTQSESIIPEAKEASFYTAVIESCIDPGSNSRFSTFNVEVAGNGTYNISFENVDKFISAAILSETPVRILKPDWLRKRILGIAEQVIKNNQ